MGSCRGCAGSCRSRGGSRKRLLRQRNGSLHGVVHSPGAVVTCLATIPHEVFQHVAQAVCAAAIAIKILFVRIDFVFPSVMGRQLEIGQHVDHTVDCVGRFALCGGGGELFFQRVQTLGAELFAGVYDGLYALVIATDDGFAREIVVV